MATYNETYEIEFPKQSMAEEIANSITHGIGLLLSVIGAVALVFLAYQHGSPAQITGVCVYGSSLIAVYLASTLSHAIQTPRWKHFFRILDQAVIYLLIAGTYTPFMVTYLPSSWRWFLFSLVWGLAISGFLSKAFFKHRINGVVVANYVLLGWVPAAAMVHLLPLSCFLWMLAGGLLYTAGAIFLSLDQRVPFFHAAWHISVMCASFCHYVAVLYFTVHVTL
jgi:hemolysin III